MNVKQAAKRLGCHPRHVRALIAKGRLKATTVVKNNRVVYVVDTRSVRKYESRPQGRGWPRGKPRKGG